MLDKKELSYIIHSKVVYRARDTRTGKTTMLLLALVITAGSVVCRFHTPTWDLLNDRVGLALVGTVVALVIAAASLINVYHPNAEAILRDPSTLAVGVSLGLLAMIAAVMRWRRLGR